MGSKAFHWCPKGCGKRVIFIGYENNSKYVSIYECQSCLRKYKKAELKF